MTDMNRPSRRGRGKAKATMELIEAAYQIAMDCEPIPVRGICYKLFTMGLIASMAKSQTDKISRHVTWAREQGIIKWEWIADETREVERVNTWSSPDQIINAAVASYRRDYWKEQPHWIEVWSEKGTVRGVLRPVLEQYGVSFRVMHGFGSATALHDFADEVSRSNKPLTVLYIGDFDPSGMCMSVLDIPSRLARYGVDMVDCLPQYGGQAIIKRIALTEPDLPGLPSFPAIAKKDDTRYRWFVEQYGHQCWELDAMDTNILRERIEGEIRSYIDPVAWDRAIEVEAVEVESMHEFHAAWNQSISRQAAKYSGEVTRHG
ncbi:hypothetical protein [Thiohalocapsa marina]|uniref:hypothetical protein n=1 Tax=Thiohalocapsa marina TaxID=424902 RepID=UPI0036DAADA3